MTMIGNGNRLDNEAMNKIISHKIPSHLNLFRDSRFSRSKQKRPNPTVEKNKNGIIISTKSRPQTEQIKIIPK